MERFEDQFGAGLKAVREHLGLAQDEMAKVLGLGTRQAVSAYEQGLRFPDGPVRVSLTSWLRSVRAPLGGMPGLTYLAEVGRALGEHRRPNLPPKPSPSAQPAPDALDAVTADGVSPSPTVAPPVEARDSGVVPVTDRTGAPGRSEAAGGVDNGEPALAGELGQANRVEAE